VRDRLREVVIGRRDEFFARSGSFIEDQSGIL